ncbi:MAG TPA: hypothetical protein VNI54_07680 [Thermoanaerobaculia bacterium]|nr:hypothetical protein [Thermoanaerobaculia bacterium]
MKVPVWLAAAALPPAIATFLGVRMIINAVQAMAMGGGGVAAVSAGMFEATRPLVWVSWLASVLAALAFVLALRAVIQDDDDEPPPRRSVPGIVIAVVALIAIVATGAMYRNTSGMIVDVLDPNADPAGSIAETSQRMSRNLLATAGTASLLTLALLVAVIVGAFMKMSEGRALVFLALLVLAAAITSAIAHQSWAAQLHHTAMTGEIR